MRKTDAVMLPANVRPSKYTLTLKPNLQSFKFTGEVSIKIEILEPSSSITLNAAEIEIRSCGLTTSNSSRMSPADTSLDEKAETVTFTFDAEVPAGPAKLDIEYTGEVGDRLRGLYRGRYTAEDGEERYLAVTQFEATDARRAFPCWDEPSLKATFQLTLVIPSDMTAISNTPIADESDAPGGLNRVRFDETPVMSTYLLAFVVGDLKSVEQRASDGTLIRVWATAGKEKHGRFALETSVKLLEYFNEYFGTPYPLAKLDHLAIPDFAAGAMENWGAITYREIVLLVDPEQSSADVRQRVAGIISHEMAHMWFGDLVTMAWWNDLWLNESFASWIGDKAIDNLFPEWEMWTQFVSTDTNNGLSLDGLKNSHPIEQEVKDPAEIGQLFDAISYSKGGSILRMLEHYLGADIFREGLRRYIARHQYGNAETRDLWAALGEASGQPVAEMMNTWVQQTGYPVLDVATTRAGEGIEISASQHRFVYEHLVEPESADDTLWRVPLSATSPDGGESAPVLMDGREATVPIAMREGGSAEDWIKVNPQQIGFFRVNYSSEDWTRLRHAIEGLQLPAIDRLGLQNDAYALAKAGYVSVTRLLSLAGAYVNETNATVWEDLALNLGRLDTLLSDEPYYSSFRDLARGIFQPVGKRMGWEAKPGEGHLNALLRSTVLTQLGRYVDEDALGKASSLFSAYQDNTDSVHPDIRGVVFNLTAKRGDETTYEALWDMQKEATLEEEKVRLLLALTNFEQPALLEQTLERSLSDDVRVHDTILVVVRVGGNRHGRNMAWEFVKDNWKEFERRYSDGLFALSGLVGMTSRFNTQEQLEDVESFFEAHPTPTADRAIKQSLEVIRLNVAWLERNRADLAEWFGG